MWDVFISHASEDKNSIARPLALALQTHGLTIWFDEDSMFAHNPLNEKIVDGLHNSQVIVLVISSRFLTKEWTIREMTLALEFENPPNCVVVPMLHDLAEDEIEKIPKTLRDRPGVSTRESLDQAIVRLVATIRSIREEKTTDWIHFAPDGWPIRHMFEKWLGDADEQKSSIVAEPQIAWPSDLYVCIHKVKQFSEKLVLASPIPEEPDWFDYQGLKLRGMDIETCSASPGRARNMAKLCAIRLARLAAGLKDTGGGYWYATYSGRIFLYLALKEIYRTINNGACIAGCSLPSSSRNDDILSSQKGRLGGHELGTVLVTSDALSTAVKPYLSGGDEISIIGRMDHLYHIQNNTDGQRWMDFFENFLVPQIELRLLVFGIDTALMYSCNRVSWRFRRFRDQNGNAI